MVSSFHLDSHCIVGATVYGPPKGPTYANSMDLTAALLDTVSQELIYGMSGPRFVAGDFNVNPGDLPAFKLWEDAGWREAQLWAFERSGQTPMPTCKGATFRDHVWLSPELLQWCESVHCLPDVFCDHAVAQAIVQIPTSTSWQFVWPMPSSLPWNEVDFPGVNCDQQQAHVWTTPLTQSFADWSHLAESELISELSHHTKVSPAAVGRGQTTAAQKRPATHVPIKAGRHGDRVPRSHIMCRAVHAWFKQVRRLQAFVQRSQSGLNTPAVQHDQCRTWTSIVHAHGFGASFASWWPNRPIQLHGSPVIIPVLPPPLDFASALLSDMTANYRHYEAWHLRKRHQIVQAKHAEHNKILFRQLRGPSADSLACLRRSQDFLVADVVSSTCIVLDSELPSWVNSCCTWTLQGVPAVVHPCGPCQLSIDTDLLLVVGQTVQVHRFVTQFQDIELDLHDLWDPIWNRHAGLADSHWDRIVNFGRAHLPAGNCDGPAWTSADFQHVLANYKRKVTRGPDAWDRQDLLALSETRTNDLCNLFHQVEAGSSWPLQLVTGFVCPIPKTTGAEVASQFRPIVLISLLYRLWASASSKTFLPFLVSRISPHIFGHVRGRRAMDFWALVQIALEVSHATSESLTGYCADLVKCFNRLPRKPLFSLLCHLGLSRRTCQGWQSALDSLERRFRIRSNVGPARRACTGFPEGDPLSCLAMLCFNCVFDVYLKVFAPDCIPLAYVDNLQLLSSTAANLQVGILVMNAFMDAWDLSLDPNKSYAWASQASHRSTLRQFGHLVCLASRDLGAQMTYSKFPRKGVFHQRLESVQHMWALLRRSSAPVWFRRLALRMALLPKLLHGCENAWIPRNSLDKLRTRCMFALGFDRAGASPLIRWSLLQPVGSDPEFYQTWQTLLCFWRMSRLFPFVQHAWVVTRYADSLAPGLLQSVECALECLGWVLDANWNLHIDDLSLTWWNVDVDTLKTLVTHCWQQSLCARWLHRQDLAGLSSIDVDVSFGYKCPTLAACELLHTIQDGTFYTSNILAKFDPCKLAVCSLCGVEDNLEHRSLCCPKYTAVRERHPEVIQRWRQMPRYFTEHALLPRNPFLWDHWKMLLALPDTTEVFHYEPASSDVRHLFSDGSCSDVCSATKRLASWNVIEMGANRVISHGVVPGLSQSIDVAELTAAISALCWTLRFQVCSVLHTDSQYVFAGIQFLLAHGYVPAKWKNQFLWHTALDKLRQLLPQQFQIHKVVSHNDETLEDDCGQVWLIRGNAKADNAAGRAQSLRSAAFQQNFRCLCSHHDNAEMLVSTQCAFLLELAQHDLAASSRSDIFDFEDLPLAILAQPTEPNNSNLAAQFELDAVGSLADDCPLGFPKQFRAGILSLVLDCDMSAARSKFVSGIELLAAYISLHPGRFPIPRTVDGVQVFELPSQVVAGGLIRLTIASALQILKQCLFHLFEIFGVLPQVGRSNRPDLGLIMSTWSIKMGWPDHIEVLAHGVVSNWFSTRPGRRACDFAKPLN